MSSVYICWINRAGLLTALPLLVLVCPCVVVSLGACVVLLGTSVCWSVSAGLGVLVISGVACVSVGGGVVGGAHAVLCDSGGSSRSC